LWRKKGLRVPIRRRRKLLGSSTTADIATAEAPSRVWAVDFEFNSTTDGQPVKTASIIDAHTRQCLGGVSLAPRPAMT
jgi:transposase InsO family protein